jgi:anti-sigma B factor antagonist
VRIEVRFKDDVAIMNLSGKFLAGSDGPFLRQKVKDLIDAGTRKLVLGFADVPYIDSTGLGFLAGSRVTAQNAGVNLVLAGLNEHVRRIMDGVRLTQFFVVVDDEASALNKVNEAVTPAASADASSAKAPKKKRSTSAPAAE